MKYSFDGHNYLVRLDKGERLAESLERFVTETKIEGAWVSGLGAALEVTLGYYDLEKKEYIWRQFEGLSEIVSLTGNLARDEAGKFVFHLHGVLSDKDFQAVGGHIRDLTAGGTVELFVHRSYRPVTRKLDEHTGLHTLDL